MSSSTTLDRTCAASWSVRAGLSAAADHRCRAGRLSHAPAEQHHDPGDPRHTRARPGRSRCDRMRRRRRPVGLRSGGGGPGDEGRPVPDTPIHPRDRVGEARPRRRADRARPRPTECRRLRRLPASRLRHRKASPPPVVGTDAPRGHAHRSTAVVLPQHLRRDARRVRHPRLPHVRRPACPAHRGRGGTRTRRDEKETVVPFLLVLGLGVRATQPTGGSPLAAGRSCWSRGRSAES